VNTKTLEPGGVITGLNMYRPTISLRSFSCTSSAACLAASWLRSHSSRRSARSSNPLLSSSFRSCSDNPLQQGHREQRLER